ncbi:WG repeat-containing protein [Pseudomonas tructae]|uniref:WG repeat-containing protein n=1 Tax=Pseudomonas tructae TaxID=2518644 RepID=UPI0013EECAF7|nr:WG repeat-containing protein [Pseudomonas tructae]
MPLSRLAKECTQLKALFRSLPLLCLGAALTACSITPADPISFRENGKYGLKDSTGKVIVAPTLELQPTYHEGLAPVRIDNKWGFMDRQGQLQIPARYTKVDGFSMGLAGACLTPDSCGYIDTKGRTVVPFDYEWVEFFRETQDGLAIVKKDGRYGMLNRKGEVVIPLRFSHRPLCQDGYVVVYENGLGGLMSTSGKQVLPFQYDGIAYNTWGGRLINDNLLSVSKEGKWGFVDLTGKVVLPFIYDSRAFFRDGQAIVKREGKHYRIDRKGNETALEYEPLKLP